MNQRDRFKTEAEYQKWLKEQFAKGGRAKNPNKGFGANPELAKKCGKLSRKKKSS